MAPNQNRRQGENVEPGTMRLNVAAPRFQTTRVTPPGLAQRPPCNSLLHPGDALEGARHDNIGRERLPTVEAASRVRCPERCKQVAPQSRLARSDRSESLRLSIQRVALLRRQTSPK